MSTDMRSVNNTNRIEVITGVQLRRRWTPEQKLELVDLPGKSRVFKAIMIQRKIISDALTIFRLTYYGTLAFD